MFTFIVRRSLLAMLTIWVLSILSFLIIQLPPGDYVLEAWHESLGTQPQNVTVATGQPAEVSFTFAQ